MDDTLKRAKMGYSDAIEYLFKASFAQVYYICLVLTGNNKKAETVLTELYKKVFSTLDRLPDETDFTVWMKNAAVVACISVMRKKNPYLLRHIGAPTVPKAEVATNRPLTTEQTARLFENCLLRMDFPAKMATICYYFNGMTRVQLSRITDLDDDEIDVVLSRVADTISALDAELREKGVVSARISPKDLLELLCLEQELPKINPKTLYVAVEPIEETAVVEPIKKGVKISAASYIAAALAVLVVAGVAVWQLSAPKEPTTALTSEIPSTESTVSAVSSSKPVSSLQSKVSTPESTVSKDKVTSSKATSSNQKPKKDEKVGKKVPEKPYCFAKSVEYNANNEKLRTQETTYSAGRIKTLKTSTPIFTENLTYSWTKNGRKCTVTDSKGTTVEITSYDANGNPTQKIFTNDTVNYSWSYSYNKQGYITSAKYTSTVNGGYTYKYDDKNRIIRKTHTIAGDTYTTDYTYYEDGMISTRTETDYDGEKLYYDYIYNYTNMTYDITCSDGSREHGLLQKN